MHASSPAHLSRPLSLFLIALGLVSLAAAFSGALLGETMRQKWYAIENSTAENTFSTSYTTVAKQTAVDAQGRVAISGNTANNREGKGIFTAKYDGETGAPLWEQRYESPNAADDVMAFMQMDAEGNVIVAGHSTYRRYHNWVILKYASDSGSLMWEKHIPTTLNTHPSPSDMVVDSSGRVILSGVFRWENSVPRGGILALSPADGSVLSEWSTSSSNSHITLCLLPSGRLAAALFDKFSALSVLALDEKWREIWRVSLPAGPVYANDFALIHLKTDAQGSLFLSFPAPAMPQQPGEYQTHDYLVSKLDATTGSILWQTRCLGALASAYPACDLAVDSMGGGVYFSGISLVSNPASDRTPHGYLTLSLDPETGARRWEKRVEKADRLGWLEKDPGSGPSLLLDGRGHVVLAGQIAEVVLEDTRHPYTTGILIQYAAADGRETWRHFLTAFKPRVETTVKAIAIDKAGEIVAAGSWQEKAFVAKHSGAHGAEYWQNFLTTSIYGNDRPLAMRMDHEGAVITVSSPDQEYPHVLNGFRFTKYAAADGSLAWKNSISFSESLISFDLDPAGNIFTIRPGAYISGYSSPRQFHVEKYSGVDGALLWTYDLPTSEDKPQTPFKILSDRKGSVIISSLLNTGSENRHLVAKLDGATGAPVWSTLSPQTVHSGAAEFVALTPDGSVIAANTALPWLDRQEPQLYYWLIKGDTGEVPWERFYETAPTGFGSSPTNILSDPGGNILLASGVSNREFASYFLLKCRASDGAAVWNAPIFSGPRPGTSFQPVLACRNGDVLVQAGALLFRYAASDGAALWARKLDAFWMAEEPTGSILIASWGTEAQPRIRTQGLSPDGKMEKFSLLLPENFKIAEALPVIGPGGKVAVHGTYKQHTDTDAAVVVYEPSPALPQTPQPLFCGLLSPGVVQATFLAEPGQIYLLEQSLNLQRWLPCPIETAADFEGVLRHTDRNTSSAQKYYRLRQP